MSVPTSAARGLRAIALVEALKGLIVLLGGFGLLGLLHRDVQHAAVSLVTRLHLNPESHYTGLFVEAAAKLTDARLWGLAALAAAYSALRAVEGYGLWFRRRWAAWLGAASGAIYVPVEIYELWSHPTAVKAATLALNVAVVIYLLWSLRRRSG
jgi:uncharacterized membrane protein (DUF2068 family)